MLRTKLMLLAITVIAAPMLAPVDAQAGPLLDWLRNHHRQKLARWSGNDCNTCGTQTPTYAYSPQTNCADNPYGLQPGQCAKTCQQTCSRTVVNYVPHTAYRTNWNRVPVTQYKPVTNNDPCTGCSVTCMKPCTTYTYQMQRVPYTTYRPVYRTESYKVPVTTITNDCATGNCNTGCDTCNTGCDTCGTGGIANQAPVLNQGTFPAPQPTYAVPNTTNYAPSASNYSPSTGTVTGTYYEYPSGGSSNNSYNGTITTEGTYSSGTQGSPADITPSLNGINPQGSYRPMIEKIQTGQQNWNNNGHQATFPQPAPSVVSYQDQTASASPVRKEWNYSPVRLASYEAPVTDRDSVRGLSSDSSSVQLRGTFKPQRTQRAVAQPVSDLNGWVEVE